MSPEFFKIGEVAEMLETTVRTIRYYEEEGLLVPHRTAGGTRLYSGHHVDRLRAIIRLAENGLSLDLIGSIANTRQTCATGNEGARKLGAIIDTVITDIERRITDLGTLKSELNASRKLIAKCKGCGNAPSSEGCPECPVNRNLKKVEPLNLIWE